MIQIMDEWCQEYGMKWSQDKTVIIPRGTAPQATWTYRQHTLTTQPPNTQHKYLGVPLSSNPTPDQTIAQLNDTLRNILSQLSLLNFNTVEKIYLINKCVLPKISYPLLFQPVNITDLEPLRGNHSSFRQA